jgi:hypothetical protein
LGQPSSAPLAGVASRMTIVHRTNGKMQNPVRCNACRDLRLCRFTGGAGVALRHHRLHCSLPTSDGVSGFRFTDMRDLAVLWRCPTTLHVSAIDLS